MTLPALLPERARPGLSSPCRVGLPRWLRKRPPGPFFIRRRSAASHPPASRSITARASSSPCRACAEKSCTVTAASLHAARVSFKTCRRSRRLSLSDLVSSICARRSRASTHSSMRGILGAQTAAAVDDQHQPHQRLAHVEIVLHEFEPARRRTLLGHFGESVPRQIDEPALRREFEEIDELRPARRAAHARQPARFDVTALIALDLPEFERPAKATSRPVSGANWPAAGRARQEFHTGIDGHGPLGRKLLSVVYNLRRPYFPQRRSHQQHEAVLDLRGSNFRRNRQQRGSAGRQRGIGRDQGRRLPGLPWGERQ